MQRKSFRTKLTSVGLSAVLILLFTTSCTQNEPQWPEITQENKPWTRWWWMGSAVNTDDLTREMEMFSQVNLGGVEITPIYGVAGFEDQFIDYLSPEWMNILEHTLSEGERLNLGIDMATGTGWPFGGPWITEDESSRRFYYTIYEATGGEPYSQHIAYTQQPYFRNIGFSAQGLTMGMDHPGVHTQAESAGINDIIEPLRENENLQVLAIEQVRFEKPLPLILLMAYSESGDIRNLTELVDQNGTLDWNPPDGNWKLFAIFEGWHGKTVERAAPGGEGFVIDHFSETALNRYLAAFDSAFAGRSTESLRAFFNDSYEVDDAQGEANWTPDFFDEFEQRRGYDLRRYLPDLLGDMETETGRRVLTDYRETISDLLLEKFTEPWNSWAQEQDALIRNQAHGSPANILDLYAASDIPETEGTDILRAKMASSAANVTGKSLSSAEAATWLNEHFYSSLSDVKRAVDRYFVSGINHVFYHGTAYSPAGDDWPGWLFYAAVHFNDRNPFWHQFTDFNSYIARVQSFLQAGQPDNNILYYYPIFDQWAEPGYGLLRHFEGGLDESLNGTYLKIGAEILVEEGYSFDFISDKQLDDVELQNGYLASYGNQYQTIILPNSDFIPLGTFEKLIELAEEGATIIAYGGLSESVPGLYQLAAREHEYNELVDRLDFTPIADRNILLASFGEGRFIQGDDLEALLEFADVPREAMVDLGLQFVRRSHDSGSTYFITNWSDETVDGWVPLSSDANSGYLFDPIFIKTGLASKRKNMNHPLEVYLQLERGESVIVQTFNTQIGSSTYPYIQAAGTAESVSENWTLQFLEGGPDLPPDQDLDQPVLWTDLNDEIYDHFSGIAAYRTFFERPPVNADGWLLNLGDVYEHATVFLNEEKIASLWGPQFTVFLSSDRFQDQNELVVEVSNGMGNRISWMERENRPWKKFYNINFPSRLAENRDLDGLFDASEWAPLPSGISGPVTLTPVNYFQPDR